MSRVSMFFILAAFVAAFLSFAVASPVEAETLAKRAHSGTGTWFNVGLGNCGKTNKDSDWIVALPTSDYASGSHCDHKIKIKANGKTATALVRDSCPSCEAGDLDMSPSLFKHFASLDDGVVAVRWWYL
ncbi:hypothetical protein PLICRDRAFT_140676 [Plicaturopsis crispa FD-325 SS-3]|nr:hypothetical protein PLICRDRAFT_140676 [Plicaturopsis crispa FD-325 SS-3]